MADTLTKWLDEEKENAHFIKEYASGKALLKMQEYKKKEEIFNSKYKTSFVEFEKKILSSKKENFKLWDDYIEWKAFYSAYKIWEKRYSEIVNV